WPSADESTPPSLKVTLVVDTAEIDTPPDADAWLAQTSRAAGGEATPGERPTTTLAADEAITLAGRPDANDAADGRPRDAAHRGAAESDGGARGRASDADGPARPRGARDARGGDRRACDAAGERRPGPSGLAGNARVGHRGISRDVAASRRADRHVELPCDARSRR